jgi:uncharacterized protein YecE (DUF72 family)
MQQPLLFDEPQAEPPPLARRLRHLASRQIYIGTSSWKYDGWLGASESLARTTELGAAEKGEFPGSSQHRAGPVRALESLARTTELGAAEKGELPGSSEHRAGPVRAIENLARTTELGAAEKGEFPGSSEHRAGPVRAIYSRERYMTRGRFSKKKFEAECLAEYAETFPAVCGDFSFYQFPSPEYWSRLFHSAPRSLIYAFKVPEAITVKTWPMHARYGSNAGQPNESFLDAAMFQQLFLDALSPYCGQVGVLIFEFGAFPRAAYERGEDFFADLDKFLAALPAGWRYSVEIRNPEFLGPEYLDVLRSRNVAHVFSSWTRMPDLSVQASLPGVRTADFQVVRALLRPGRSYENAVKQFSPYEKVQEVYDSGREALRGIIRHGLDESQATFLFVNNRFEGNAPETIAAIVGD